VDLVNGFYPLLLRRNFVVVIRDAIRLVDPAISLPSSIRWKSEYRHKDPLLPLIGFSSLLPSYQERSA